MLAESIGVIDPACPINRAARHTAGLEALWLPVGNAGWTGGLTLRDLCGARPASFTNPATAPASEIWSPGLLQRRRLYFHTGAFCDARTINHSGGLTVMAAFRMIGTRTTNSGIVAKYETVSPTNQRSWALYINNQTYGGGSGKDPRVSFIVSSDGTFGGATNVDGTSKVVTGSNYFVAGRYVPSDQINIWVSRPGSGMHINLEASNTTSIPSATYNSNQTIYIGRQANGTDATGTLNGAIYFVAVFTRILSSGTIRWWRDEFKSGFQNTLNFLPSPVFYSIPASVGLLHLRRRALAC